MIYYISHTPGCSHEQAGNSIAVNMGTSILALSLTLLVSRDVAVLCVITTVNEVTMSTIVTVTNETNKSRQITSLLKTESHCGQIEHGRH